MHSAAENILGLAEFQERTARRRTAEWLERCIRDEKSSRSRTWPTP